MLDETLWCLMRTEQLGRLLGMTRLVGVIGGAAMALMIASGAWAQSLSTTQKGLVGGGLLGAGAGAIVGAAVHHPIAGAAIGGGVGLVAGGAVGHELQNNETQQRQQQAELAAQQAQIERQRQQIQQLQQTQQVQDTE
jgi:phage tail tape-measure protein